MSRLQQEMEKQKDRISRSIEKSKQHYLSFDKNRLDHSFLQENLLDSQHLPSTPLPIRHRKYRPLQTEEKRALKKSEYDYQSLLRSSQARQQKLSQH